VVSGTPTPNVSALEAFAGAGFGVGGSAAFGPEGLLLAGLPLARPVARNALLSGPAQRTLATPSYEPAMRPEDPLLTLLRQATLAQERNK
jgi:hypothetical protein